MARHFAQKTIPTVVNGLAKGNDDPLLAKPTAYIQGSEASHKQCCEALTVIKFCHATCSRTIDVANDNCRDMMQLGNEVGQTSPDHHTTIPISSPRHRTRDAITRRSWPGFVLQPHLRSYATLQLSSKTTGAVTTREVSLGEIRSKCTPIDRRSVHFWMGCKELVSNAQHPMYN